MAWKHFFCIGGPRESRRDHSYLSGRSPVLGYSVWGGERVCDPRDILTDRVPRGACGCAVGQCWLLSLLLSTHTELVIDASHVGWCIVRELHTYVTEVKICGTLSKNLKKQQEPAASPVRHNVTVTRTVSCRIAKFTGRFSNANGGE